MSGRFISEEMELGPWSNGDKVTYRLWTDGYAIGMRFNVNGVISWKALNPSSEGESPDVFIYETEGMAGGEVGMTVEADGKMSGFDPIMYGGAIGYIGLEGSGESDLEILSKTGERVCFLQRIHIIERTEG